MKACRAFREQSRAVLTLVIRNGMTLALLGLQITTLFLEVFVSLRR